MQVLLNQPQEPTREGSSVSEPEGMSVAGPGRRIGLSALAVFLLAMACMLPTTGDVGLTWDEPAYRFSQLRSGQWWERLGAAQSWSDAEALLDADALLFYWTYGRHGINFHPPLAGQLNLLSHAVLGHWMKDVPARRVASELELALVAALGFGFLARRYGRTVGLVCAGALLLTPRVQGDAHVAGTDMPGLLIWVAAALAFWKGVTEPGARRWRILVGILIGLGFVEKMSAIFVLGPLLGWLILTRLPLAARPGRKESWIDGIVTSAAMLLPLGLAFWEILRLARELPIPSRTDLFYDQPASRLSGWILALPAIVWLGRRLLGRLLPRHPVWGAERPGLEIWTAVLGFAPLVGWLGNPAWWRETLPRLAHYYMLNTDRQGSLTPIQIYYLGKTYEFSLPWHNAWVLMAVTVPAAILLASACGLVWALFRARRDSLPLFFLLNLAALPAIRMLPTPAHDGVRLLLPVFFFLSAFAGWGVAAASSGLTWAARGRFLVPLRGIMTAIVLAPSAWQLIQIHPYELSYYNEFVGGPRVAWDRDDGFELTYWYDAFTPSVIAALNEKLPEGAQVDFLNKMSNPMVFMEHQSLGHLKPSLILGWRDTDRFPFVWLLTQDSKATTFTRLLHAMTPWHAERPAQLDGARVLTVADPLAVSRAWALWLLVESPNPKTAEPRDRPPGVAKYTPWLGRFWDDGLTRVRLKSVNESIFSWARTSPETLRDAAELLAGKGHHAQVPNARKLWLILTRGDSEAWARPVRLMLRARPQALVEAVEILVKRPATLREALSREAYLDVDRGGGFLDRDLGISPK